MNKKIICSLLSAVISTGVFPVFAFAADSPFVQITEGIDLRNIKTDVGGSGWKWNADDLTLTLNDFRAKIDSSVMYNEPLFHLPDESTIILDGDDNMIETHAHHSDIFYCEGELLICGTGKLDLIVGAFNSSPIYCKGGPLTIEDSLEITVDPAGHIIFIEKARGTKPIINMMDDTKITFPEEDADDQIILVTHSSNVPPSENWLNFSMEYDEFDETISIIAKTEAAKTDELPFIPKEPPVTSEDSASNEYQIVIGNPAIMKNGEVSYTADVSPYLKNGYTMLPLRALLEVSNPEQKVNWNNETKSACTLVNNKSVNITPGEKTYTKASEKIKLSTPAETVNGRLFVSLRDWMSIMEINGSQLDWNAKTKTVTLKY